MLGLMLNVIGMTMLWLIGMFVLPLLAAFITVFLSKDSDYGVLVFWIAFTTYWIATAILLILI